MTGICKFCGQMVQTGIGVPDPDAIAHEYCDCKDAQEERRIQYQIESAQENIDALFGTGCESMGFVPLKEQEELEVLKRIAAEVARNRIVSASLLIFGGGKATISYGRKGEVKVTRQIVRAQTMEAGMFG